MKFTVEAWAPEYGTPTEATDVDVSAVQIDFGIESPAHEWTPRKPAPGTASPQTIVFVDGVRRIDGRVWIVCEDGSARPGICASFAAGTVMCADSRAELASVTVKRGLFTAAPGAEEILTPYGAYPVRAVPGETPEAHQLALQERMDDLEVEVAHEAPDADLLVIDGPLRGRQRIAGAIGYVKTHHLRYLPPALEPILGALAAGERTPLYLITTSWSRYSWYVRLPGAAGHPWAGIVRCESSADAPSMQAVEAADIVTQAVPRFASEAHKDPRAPQNLYPVGGLEQELRRRLGDPQLLYRGLRKAAV